MNARSIGPFCLCFIYPEGKLNNPIIKTTESSNGCITSSEAAMKPIDPTPPHKKRLNKIQWTTQSPEKKIPNLSFTKKFLRGF